MIRVDEGLGCFPQSFAATEVTGCDLKAFLCQKIYRHTAHTTISTGDQNRFALIETTVLVFFFLSAV